MDLTLLRINNVFDSLVIFLKLPFVVSSISDSGIVEFDISVLFSTLKRLVCVISVVLFPCIKVVVISVVGSTPETKVVTVL